MHNPYEYDLSRSTAGPPYGRTDFALMPLNLSPSVRHASLRDEIEMRAPALELAFSRGRPPGIRDEEWQDLRAFCLDARTQRDIATVRGLQPQSVRQRLLRAARQAEYACKRLPDGWPEVPAPRKYGEPAPREEVLEALNDTPSLDEAAKRLHTSESSLTLWMKKLGIKKVVTVRYE